MGRTFEVARELLQLRLPEVSIPRDPLQRRAHRFGGDACATHAPLPLDGRQPRALEHTDVLRDRGERHVEPGGKLTDGAFPAPQARQDLATGRVGERGEGGVERLR